MIRVNSDTPLSVLIDIKAGDFVTDTFSKTGIVEKVECIDDGLHRIFTFYLVTGRSIEIKKL